MGIVIVVILVTMAGLGVVAIVPRFTWAHHPTIAILCTLLWASAITLAFLTPGPPLALRVGIAIAAITAATLSGWPVTTVILQLALKLPPREPSAALPATGWVGLVERFGFSLALMLGLPEVAALIIAIKALGSYTAPQKTGNQAAAARVLGTLTSVSWALMVSAIYLLLAPSTPL